MSEHIDYVDVIVVGAGISGIGAGYHLQDKCPDRTYLILEGRENLLSFDRGFDTTGQRRIP